MYFLLPTCLSKDQSAALQSLKKKKILLKHICIFFSTQTFSQQLQREVQLHFVICRLRILIIWLMGFQDERNDVPTTRISSPVFSPVLAVQSSLALIVFVRVIATPALPGTLRSHHHISQGYASRFKNRFFPLWDDLQQLPQFWEMNEAFPKQHRFQ